jgi:GH15 family glucan-1,4-alpha-glucosidase
MCWAGLERIQRIQKKGYLRGVDFDLGKALTRAEASVRAAIRDGSLRNGPKDESYDSALLSMPMLRFPDRDACRETVQRVHEALRFGAGADESSFLYRYLRKDDFGHPQSSFLICSFWLAQSMALVGRTEDARKVMRDTVSSANATGLFAEHYFPKGRKQAGNFPQAYSHVGLINAAFAVSPPWHEVL